MMAYDLWLIRGRHTLAREIPSLLIIGGVLTPNDPQDYFDQVKAEMPHACFTRADGKSWILEDQVAAALNTASTGGRDEWFDTRFVRVIRDDSSMIADAVRELIGLRLSPHWIRQQTLRTLWDHPRRFLEVGQKIYDREQTGRDFARDFYASFFNKQGPWRDLNELMPSFPSQNETRTPTRS